jgi:hypothetical protein
MCGFWNRGRREIALAAWGGERERERERESERERERERKRERNLARA